MDMRLLEGDHALDGRRLPATVTGVEELLQRASIRLTVKRGSFPLDPTLGSRLHELKRSGIPRMEQLALGYAQDALAPMAEVQVQAARCTFLPQQDRLLLELQLQVAGREELLALSL